MYRYSLLLEELGVGCLWSKEEADWMPYSRTVGLGLDMLLVVFHNSGRCTPLHPEWCLLLPFLAVPCNSCAQPPGNTGSTLQKQKYSKTVGKLINDIQLT